MMMNAVAHVRHLQSIDGALAKISTSSDRQSGQVMEGPGTTRILEQATAVVTSTIAGSWLRRSVLFKPTVRSGLDVLKRGDKIRPLQWFRPGRLADAMLDHVADVALIEVVSSVQIHGQMRCLP